MKTERSSTLVYSTDPATRLAANEPARVDAIRPAANAGVRLSYETKGRKGKGVTIVRDAPLAPADMQVLGKQLRSQCGSGGTIKDGVIEIQGDHRDRVTMSLQARGWVVKRVGG